MTALETHMSWVFLCGDRAFKLKKPVVRPFIDFSTLAAREFNCREELRLNRRLAPDTYLRVVPLVSQRDGGLALDGEGTVVEWLLEMRRLPEQFMLDRLIKAGAVTDDHLHKLVDALAAFYRVAEHPAIDPLEHLRMLEYQNEINRQMLRHEEFDVDHQAIRHLLDDVDCALHRFREEITHRIQEGRYVEGHGDLRSEHICFSQPIAIFDCLEFDRELRMIDPFDEIAFLGMECAFLGAPAIAETVFELLRQALKDQVSSGLRAFYTAFRATLRARMCYSHLLDGSAVLPELWEGRTSRYTSLARVALRRCGPSNIRLFRSFRELAVDGESACSAMNHSAHSRSCAQETDIVSKTHSLAAKEGIFPPHQIINFATDAATTKLARAASLPIWRRMAAEQISLDV